MGRSSMRIRADRGARRVAVGIVAIVGLLGGGAVASGGARPSETAVVPAREVRARGLEYAGLDVAAPGPCTHGFRIATGSGPGRCRTALPPAPADVDVTKMRTAAALLAAGVDANPSASGTVRCIGDGVSGPRV